MPIHKIPIFKSTAERCSRPFGKLRAVSLSNRERTLLKYATHRVLNLNVEHTYLNA